MVPDLLLLPSISLRDVIHEKRVFEIYQLPSTTMSSAWHMKRAGFRVSNTLRNVNQVRALHRTPINFQSPARLDAHSDSKPASESSSTSEKGKERSRHGEWYASTLPAMLPIAALAYAVYLVRLSTPIPFHRGSSTAK